MSFNITKLLFDRQFRSLFLRLVLMLFVLLLLPIISLSYLYYWSNQSIIVTSIDKVGTEKINKQRRFIDVLLRDVDQKTIQLANNERFLKSIESAGIDPSTEMIYQFVDFATTICCMQSIDFYYKGLGFHYSQTNGIQPIVPLNANDRFEYSQLNESRLNWFVRQNQRDKSSLYITLLRAIPVLGKQSDGFIMVNLNPRLIFTSPFTQETGEQLWLITPDRLHAFSLRDGLRIPMNDWSGIMGRLLQNQTAFNHAFQGKQYSFRTETSDLTGWTYLYAVPTDVLRSNSGHEKIILLILVDLILIVSGIYIFIFIRRFMRTVSSIDDALGRTNTHRGRFDFSLLTQEVRSLVQRENAAELQLRESLPALRQSLFEQLLKGEIESKEEVGSKLKSFGITMTPFGFFVMVIHIDKYPEFLIEHTPSDQLLFRYFVAKLAEEIAAQRFAIISVINRSKEVNLLCNLRQETALISCREEAVRVMYRMKENFQNYLKLSLSLSVGDWVQDMGRIPESYQQAVYALEVEAFKNNMNAAAIGWEHVPSNSNLNHLFQKRRETGQKLIAAFRAEDSERAALLIQEFYEFVKPLHGCSIMDIQYHVCELSATMMQSGLDLGVKISLEMQWTPLDAIQGMETLDEVFEWLKRYVLQWFQALAMMKHQKTDVIQEILNYLEVNFNQDISLSGLADRLKLSASYLSRLFKQEVGVNLMQHLTSLRIERAKQLLVNTNLNVNEIGQSLGYLSAHSFIRVFKNSVGVTPGLYRSKHQPKSLFQK